ncbi:hypothetical protein [Celeribacter sp.]|uniref:hypothetical protein n=1 Tax=Celeribacter sp. TaxID=1890673 RepID=UPI003A91BD99
MLKWFEFLKNFPFGIFVGFISAMTLFWLFGADISEDLTRYGTYVLTAMASLLASAVAFATAIWNTERQRDARLKVARANLPLALSHLIEVCSRGYEYAKELQGWDDVETNFPNLRDDIRISEDALDTINDVIENSDDTTADWLSIFLAHYQVFSSRLDGRRDEAFLHDIRYHFISDAADWRLLTAIVNHLFDYSRTGTTPATKIDKTTFSVPLLERHTETGKQLAKQIERVFDYYEGLTISGLRKKFKEPSASP